MGGNRHAVTINGDRGGYVLLPINAIRTKAGGVREAGAVLSSIMWAEGAILYPSPSLHDAVCTAIIISLLVIIVFAGSSTELALGIAAGILLLACCTCLCYERRLRRVGRTAEAKAAAELSAREGSTHGGTGHFVEEEDVAIERHRVESEGASGASGNAVWIQKLRKVYPARGKAAPKVAVVDLSLGVPKAECFGFLGVNGAGKTTTLSILTGDYLPSGGRAWIDGYDVVSDENMCVSVWATARRADPLIELMTARETLIMFARLKNLPEISIPRIVRSLLEKVTLTPYADRVAGSYSGGNKRKLSLAIALVGSLPWSSSTSHRVVWTRSPSAYVGYHHTRAVCTLYCTDDTQYGGV